MRAFAVGALAVGLAAVGCSKKADPTTRATTDKDRLQGVWAVESVEGGTELAPPARRRLTNARLHVRGNRFTFGEGTDWDFYTFGADTGREPKSLVLFECDSEGNPPPAGKGLPKPPRSRVVLYKFDGDKLVLAFLAGSDADSVPPPADFRPDAGPNAVVLRLVTTNEEPRTKWDPKPAPDPKKK